MDDYETVIFPVILRTNSGTQLRPRSLVNETTNLDTLENSLEKLGEAVNVKALPEAMMDIVHVQIHPMLQRIYDLEIQRTVMPESQN